MTIQDDQLIYEYLGRVADAALFLLGFLLLNYPLLDLFAGPSHILGIPALYVYVFAAWALLIFREGRRLRSPALTADARHLFTDVATSFGVIAGVLLAVWTGVELIDPIVAVLVAQGLPPWDSNRHAHLASPAAWKVPPVPLARTQEVLRAEDAAGPGPWLLPVKPMQVLPLLTTSHASVVPRRFYVNDLPEPAADHAARLVLWRLARGQGHAPSPESVRQSLLQLQVSLACVTRRDPVRVQVLDAAVGLPGERVAGMDCHVLHLLPPGAEAARPLRPSGPAAPSPRRTGSPRPAPSPGSAGASGPAGRPPRAR